MRRVKAWRLKNLELTGADCFVLDMLAVNIPYNLMDQVGKLLFFIPYKFLIKLILGAKNVQNKS